MSHQYICDKCGKTAEGTKDFQHLQKPKGWGVVAINVTMSAIPGRQKYKNSRVNLDYCDDCFIKAFPLKDNETVDLKDPLLAALDEYIDNTVADLMSDQGGY